MLVKYWVYYEIKNIIIVVICIGILVKYNIILRELIIIVIEQKIKNVYVYTLLTFL